MKRKKPSGEIHLINPIGVAKGKRESGKSAKSGPSLFQP
jgi:hypothetical protein